MRVYINGKFFDKADAKVSVYDHGLLYGDGVFEGIRVYHGKVFKHHEHIERLYESARSVAIDIPMDVDAMRKVVLDTLRRNQLKDSYVRLMVTRGVGDLGLHPRKCSKASVIVITDTIKLYPADAYEHDHRAHADRGARASMVFDRSTKTADEGDATYDEADE